jgi:hypothetical protein
MGNWVIKNAKERYYKRGKESWSWTTDVNEATQYPSKGDALDVSDEQQGETAVEIVPVGGWREK